MTALRLQQMSASLQEQWSLDTASVGLGGCINTLFVEGTVFIGVDPDDNFLHYVCVFSVCLLFF